MPALRGRKLPHPICKSPVPRTFVSVKASLLAPSHILNLRLVFSIHACRLSTPSREWFSAGPQMAAVPGAPCGSSVTLHWSVFISSETSVGIGGEGAALSHAKRRHVPSLHPSSSLFLSLLTSRSNYLCSSFPTATKAHGGLGRGGFCLSREESEQDNRTFIKEWKEPTI